MPLSGSRCVAAPRFEKRATVDVAYCLVVRIVFVHPVFDLRSSSTHQLFPKRHHRATPVAQRTAPKNKVPAPSPTNSPCGKEEYISPIPNKTANAGIPIPKSVRFIAPPDSKSTTARRAPDSRPSQIKRLAALV